MNKIIAFLCFLTSYSAFSSEASGNTLDKINNVFGEIVNWYGAKLFAIVPGIKLPFILVVMVIGGLFFTFRYGLVNIKLFKHAIDVIRGKYDDPDDGEISHFQALTSAL